MALVKNQLLALSTAALAAVISGCGNTASSASIKDIGPVGPICPDSVSDFSDDTLIDKQFGRLLASSKVKDGYIPAVIQVHSNPGKKSSRTCVTWAGVTIQATKKTKGLKLRLIPDGIKGMDTANQALVTKSEGEEVLNLGQMVTLGDSLPIYFLASAADTGAMLSVTGSYITGPDEFAFKAQVTLEAGKAKADILKDDSKNELRIGFGASKGAADAGSGGGGSSASGSSSGSATGSASGSSSGSGTGTGS